MSNDLEKRYCGKPIELRDGSAGPGSLLVGYAAVYNSRSALIEGHFYEVIRPGAFARSLKETPDVYATVEHDLNRVIGRTSAGTLRLAEDEVGLRAEIDLPDTSFARDLREQVRRGDMRGMSFSFNGPRDEWRKDADGKPLRELIDLNLREVTVTVMPAYPATSVSLRALERAKSFLDAPAGGFQADYARLSRLLRAMSH